MTLDKKVKALVEHARALVAAGHPIMELGRKAADEYVVPADEYLELLASVADVIGTRNRVARVKQMIGEADGTC